MTAKNILKKWFENFKKPTQEQFWEWLDSYWHKSEKIPIQKVEGFIEMLDNKVDKEAGKELSDNNFTDELKEKLENLQSSANVREINETFTVTENDLSGSEIQLILSNNIAPFSHVIVETENFILKAESISYEVNTNKVTILKQELYFNFELNENITVYYAYLDDGTSVAEHVRDLELVSLTHSVNSDSISVNFSIKNNATFDDTAKVYAQLLNVSSKKEYTIPLISGNTDNRQQTYNNIPPGTYRFELTGDVEGNIDNIIIQNYAPHFIYDSFTVQNSDNTYTANVIVSNSGNKTGETSVYFQLDNGNKVKIGNFAIPPNTSKTFTKTFNVAGAGNHVITAFEADGVTKIGSTYEFSVENRPAEIDWIKAFNIIYKKNHVENFADLSLYNGFGAWAGYGNGSIYRFYFEFDTSKVTSCVGAEIYYYVHYLQRNFSEKEFVESTAANYSAQTLFDSHNNTNLIENITQNNSGGGRAHFHVKLTNLAVNLINSSSKFSILVKAKDDLLNCEKYDEFNASAYDFDLFTKKGVSPKLKLTY